MKWAHVCSFNRVTEEVLRKFALETFGKGYFSLPHGVNEAAKPFGLMVKRPRSIWLRPLKKYKLTIVDGMEEYLPLDKKIKFLDALKLHIKKDDNLMLPEHDEDSKGAARYTI